MELTFRRSELGPPLTSVPPSSVRMKYLKDKPVNSLRDEQFLKLYMAEEEKLLELDIGNKITNYSGQNYVDEAKGLYARVRLHARCPRLLNLFESELAGANDDPLPR